MGIVLVLMGKIGGLFIIKSYLDADGRRFQGGIAEI